VLTSVLFNNTSTDHHANLVNHIRSGVLRRICARISVARVTTTHQIPVADGVLSSSEMGWSAVAVQKIRNGILRALAVSVCALMEKYIMDKTAFLASSTNIGKRVIGCAEIIAL
jgi:hypothetical protein